MISLSHDTEEVLNIIYDKYKRRLSSNKRNYLSTVYSKVFYTHSLFPCLDDVIHSIIELSNKNLINFFSDGRIMIKDEAISYIERCFMEC